MKISIPQDNIQETEIHFDTDWQKLQYIAQSNNAFIITDEHLEFHYHDEMKPWKSIVIPPGEESKDWAIIDDIIRQLLALNADRSCAIVGIGGGVVMDIAGFVAAIYKRGVKCVLVPTSILAMCDAAIGGKNGINIGTYKNMIGTIKLPKALIYNTSLLQTLPEEEWINGFAEIIKHAAIADKELFEYLQKRDITYFMNNLEETKTLIQKNIAIKSKIVESDFKETGLRKILNFGHTIGHALEYQYQLKHGFAISIGMYMTAVISDKILNSSVSDQLSKLLLQYNLPIAYQYNKTSVMTHLMNDKKRFENQIDFVLLKAIGTPVIHELPISMIKELI